MVFTFFASDTTTWTEFERIFYQTESRPVIQLENWCDNVARVLRIWEISTRTERETCQIVRIRKWYDNKHIRMSQRCLLTAFVVWKNCCDKFVATVSRWMTYLNAVWNKIIEDLFQEIEKVAINKQIVQRRHGLPTHFAELHVFWTFDGTDVAWVSA